MKMKVEKELRHIRRVMRTSIGTVQTTADSVVAGEDLQVKYTATHTATRTATRIATHTATHCNKKKNVYQI